MSLSQNHSFENNHTALACRPGCKHQAGNKLLWSSWCHWGLISFRDRGTRGSSSSSRRCTLRFAGWEANCPQGSSCLRYIRSGHCNLKWQSGRFTTFASLFGCWRKSPNSETSYQHPCLYHFHTLKLSPCFICTVLPSFFAFTWNLSEDTNTCVSRLL